MDQGFLGYGSVRGAHGVNGIQPARFEPVGIECDFRRRRALEICVEAQTLHLKGQTAKAIPIYAKSIRLRPTAEAHAFLGWAYSAHGRYDLAVRECLRAIEIDPDYGNPYNDIGSYYVSQGKLDESIVWFERAKRATRYESPHFPYLNLGRVFAAQGLKIRAIREYERALAIEPGEDSCLVALKGLRGSLLQVL